MSLVTLHQLIESELELMEHFLYSLEKENALLLSSYTNDDLFDLTELKNQYAEQLTQISVLRDNEQTKLNLPIGREGLILAQTQHAELSPLIQQLFDTAESAKTYNEQNGLLIQAYLDYSIEAIEALNSANPDATKTQVYDAKGMARTKNQLRRGAFKA